MGLGDKIKQVMDTLPDSTLAVSTLHYPRGTDTPWVFCVGSPPGCHMLCGGSPWASVCVGSPLSAHPCTGRPGGQQPRQSAELTIQPLSFPSWPLPPCLQEIGFRS